MRRRLRLLVLVVVLGAQLATGCDLFDDDEDAVVPVPFESLSEAECLRVLEPGTEVFTTEDEWKTFWSDHLICIEIAGPLPAPTVDFASEMLIGIYWGGGYSGCSSLVEAVDSIEIHNQRIEVRVGPLPGLGECLAVVYPIQIVRIPRSELPVVFLPTA